MAQTLLLPIEQVFTDLGAIGAGFKLYTYGTGTSTPLATYSDTALSVANANPTIADSAGRFIQIFIGDAKLYKAVLKDADDVTVWTADPIDPKIFSLNDFDPRPTSFWGTTAGTSSAYTLIADPVISAYANTQTFFLDFHTASAAGPTIAINGLTALNIHKPDGAGGTIALEANDVLVGTYEARNNGTNVIILNPELPSASETVAGLIELATAAEIATGTDTGRAVTPANQAYTLIATATASASSDITFTDLNSTYAKYIVELIDVTTTTDNTSIWLRVSEDNGSSYDSGATDYKYGGRSIDSSGVLATINGNGDAKINMANELGSGTNEKISGTIEIYNPSASTFTHAIYSMSNIDTTETAIHTRGSGYRRLASAVDAIQIILSSGNIASGTIKLYGVKA